jgi:hypothetical protein
MRLKVLLLSLLAVLAAGSAMSTTASATGTKGPFWHVNGAKLSIGVQEAYQAKGHLVLDGNLLGQAIEIECQFASKGTIDNNQAQGKALSTTEFNQCRLVKPVVSGCVVTVKQPETRSELAWSGKVGEEGQKMVLLFAPQKGNIFTAITLEKCGVLNSKSTVETNASQGWGTAAFTTPENAEALEGELKWVKPNITAAHHQGMNVTVGLKFAGAPAELQSKEVVVTLHSGKKFGAFEE